MAELIAKVKTEGAGTAEKELNSFVSAAERADSAVAKMADSVEDTNSTLKKTPAAAKPAKKAIDEIDNTTKATDKTLGKFKVTASGAFTALKVGLGAATAFAGALTAVIVKAAGAEDQIADLAAQAGMSVNAFKEVSFAFKTVGVSQEGFADTVRKLNSEMGQFASQGTGGFKTALEAVAGKSDLTAESLAKLSGIDALQALKNSFDQANIPIKEQAFLLDGVVKGGSKMLPLLANQGAALDEATRKYNEFNNAIMLSGAESSALGAVADEIDLLETTMANAASFVVAKFAPQIIGAIDYIAKAATDGAQALVLFFDSFSTNAAAQEVGTLNTRIDELLGKQQALSEELGKDRSPVFLKKTQLQINATQLQIDELIKQKAKLEGKKAADEAAIVEAPAPIDDKANAAEITAAKAAAKLREQRLKDGAEFVKQTERINQTATQQAESAATDLRMQAEQFAKDGAITAQQRADALLEIEDNLSAAKLKIIQDRQTAEAAVVQAAADKRAGEQGQADTFINAMKMQGLSELETIREVERQKLAELEAWNAKGLVSAKDYQTAKQNIENEAAAQAQNFRNAQAQLVLSSGEQLFGALASLQAEFGDKQSTTYKVMFGLQKGFALASAILNMSSAIAQTMASPASLTPAQKFAEAAMVGTSVANVISNIASLDYSPRQQGGQFRRNQTLKVGEKGAEIIQFGSGKGIEKNMAAKAIANVRAGDTMLVGQNGAEIIQFPMGGRVATASQTAAMMQGKQSTGLSMLPARSQGGQFAANSPMLVGEKGVEKITLGAGESSGATPVQMTIINQTTGRIDQMQQVPSGDENRLIFIAKETIVREINNPNSDTNKALDRTRNIQRRMI